jgi:ADP-ribose pyrophosphatase YjhB (NUDIX family)
VGYNLPMIESKVNRNGTIVRYVWKPLVSLNGIEPIWQVYGLCFTKDGKLCIIRNQLLTDGFTPWYLPGGTPKDRETPKETLIREVDEEIDCDISNLKLLGANEVFFPNNPNKDKGDHYYQLRYFAIIENVKGQTPDPHDGQLVERKFINPNEFLDFVKKWGKIGESVIKAGIIEFDSWKKKQ